MSRRESHWETYSVVTKHSDTTIASTLVEIVHPEATISEDCEGVEWARKTCDCAHGAMAHSSQFESFGPLSVSRRERRVLEGGPISEERFLQLQSEVYRLRKEANARDEEHKLWGSSRPIYSWL